MAGSKASCEQGLRIKDWPTVPKADYRRLFDILAPWDQIGLWLKYYAYLALYFALHLAFASKA
ncbi:hypothetical protein SLS62_004967 [Diatrype stigma]|uniref:Uncharacterized protein n=1 Tax=Diatrype stigma TaxID=117547 RepID=A0AAN9YNT3_9PEZI